MGAPRSFRFEGGPPLLCVVLVHLAREKERTIEQMSDAPAAVGAMTLDDQIR